MVLGVDPSVAKTGWVILDKDKKVLDRGTIKTRGEFLWYDVERYKEIRKKIGELIKKHGISQIAQEGPVFGGYTSEGLFGLYLFLQDLYFDLGLKVIYLAPHSHRHIAKGILGEKIMGIVCLKRKMEKIFELNVFRKMDEHQIDAFWVGWCGSRFWDFVEGKIKENDFIKEEKNIYLRKRVIKRGLLKGEILEEGLFFKKNKLWFDFGDGSRNL